jgi:hypothetical protein
MKLFSLQRQYCGKNKKSIPHTKEMGLDLFQIVAALEKPVWREFGQGGTGRAWL